MKKRLADEVTRACSREPIGTKGTNSLLWWRKNNEEIKTLRAGRTDVGSATNKTATSGRNAPQGRPQPEDTNDPPQWFHDEIEGLHLQSCPQRRVRIGDMNTECERFVDPCDFGWRSTLKSNCLHRNSRLANDNTEEYLTDDLNVPKWPDIWSFLVEPHKLDRPDTITRLY